MRRPGIALLALALLAVVFATTPAEQANAQTPQTFVANLGQSDGGASPLANDYAQAFTTGSNSAGYSLRSVDVEFGVITSSFSSSSLTASIHAESGGSPGSSLGTLTKPASFPVSSSAQTLTFTSSAGIDLAANTTYFLVIDISSDEPFSNLRITNSDAEDSGQLAGWSIGDGTLFRAFSSTGTWNTGTSSLKLGLDGVSKTPVPVTTLVSSTGQSQSVFNGLTHDHAQAFTTGSAVNGYTVTGATWSLLGSPMRISVRTCRSPSTATPAESRARCWAP
ncbi:MAG: hypothetical protein F4Y25_01275 [Chloroflexi bacterium]|nr:hypothetical protein [Chloroflexota bacterium]